MKGIIKKTRRKNISKNRKNKIKIKKKQKK